ncbi:hypothetical protein ACFY0R_42415, partial [Streptomyces sp. NPDC001633]|uniref:hypothetical protein n=1 Tax=Streptomyces sp. NPDC001633 TaxID=3364595 RepID=UPI00367AFEB9
LRRQRYSHLARVVDDSLQQSPRALGTDGADRTVHGSEPFGHFLGIGFGQLVQLVVQEHGITLL